MNKDAKPCAADEQFAKYIVEEFEMDFCIQIGGAAFTYGTWTPGQWVKRKMSDERIESLRERFYRVPVL